MRPRPSCKARWRTKGRRRPRSRRGIGGGRRLRITFLLDQLGVDRLDKGGLVFSGVSARVAEHFLGDLGARAPPVHHQRVHLVLNRHLLGNSVEHLGLRAAMTVDDDDVLEAVAHQPCKHRPNVRRIHLSGDVGRPRIRTHAPRHSVGDMRRDQGVHLGRDRFGNLHRSQIVRAVRRDAVRLEGAGGEQDRFDLRRHNFPELHPVQLVHPARRRLLGWRGKADREPAGHQVSSQKRPTRFHGFALKQIRERELDSHGRRPPSCLVTLRQRCDAVNNEFNGLGDPRTMNPSGRRSARLDRNQPRMNLN